MSENAVSQAEHGMERYFFRASAEDFKKIPGNFIAYWISDSVRSIFDVKQTIEDIAPVRQGFQTGDNDRFLRLWWEVSIERVEFDAKNTIEFHGSGKTFAPYNKGGEWRKWYGNNDYLVAFDQCNYELLARMGNKLPSRHLYFHDSITWSALSSGKFGARYNGTGFTFSAKGACAFPRGRNFRNCVLGLLNSNVCDKIFEFISATMDFNVGSIRNIPFLSNLETTFSDIININCEQAIDIASRDWDSVELSWDFAKINILKEVANLTGIADAYKHSHDDASSTVRAMQDVEQKNSRIFIEAYGLQNELSPEVPLEEITLTCNPHYRYGGNKSEEELEALLLQDTMAEFCSYAVGCMFGRYSLDKPGLVLANQGDTLQDYLQQVPQPSFRPDDDNVIPLLDADWFADDVTGRFLEFLRVTFGTEHYAENLAFVERGLNIKNKRNYSIRDFFVKEFYDYHVRMYKKRPIYWLFASPNGSFQALVYLHRYRPDTVSVVLRYLREFRDKLAARRQLVEQRLTDASASQGEKTRLTKELEQLRKQILELDDYEHDVLFPLAGQRLEIDLDDGVKANYPKFGKALKKVAGLS